MLLVKEIKLDAVAGVLFAHIGKHTPFLLVENNIIPPVVKAYIKSVKPVPTKDMPMPPFMHSFIIGNTSYINYSAQVLLESLLSIDTKMG